MNILALEASTSSAKAIVYSSHRGVLDVSSIPYPESVCDVISLEPEGMFQTLMACGAQAVKKAGCSIDAIGLAGTWHSLLFLDGERKPLGRILTWANTGAAPTVKEARKDQRLGHWLYERTGCAIHSMYPLWKTLHASKQGKKALSNVAYLSSQPEYIFEKLTGKTGISRSAASGSGFFNIHTLEWDEDILAYAGITREMMAPLKEPDYDEALSSEAARLLGLNEGIPVVIGGPDGALNQIGGGAMEEGIMTLSIGTSGALRVASDEPLLPKDPSTWCYYLAEGKRIAGAATSGAGNCIEWFIRKLGGGHLDYERLDQAMEGISYREAPIFLPFLYGERCPGWQDQRPGGFWGVRGDHDLGHLYYALLEGILFNLYHCYTILAQVGGTPKQIRISGGIENSPRWLQMAADIFQREMVTSRLEHASTMGAVALALKAMGGIERLEDFQPEAGELIRPDAGKANLYRERFEEYLKWYKKSGEEGEKP